MIKRMRDVIWNAPILDCSGFAAAARGYLLACEAAGIRCRAIDDSGSKNIKGFGLGKDVLDLYARMSDTSISSSATWVCHHTPDKLRRTRQQRNVGYTIFEMTTIPKAWTSYCNAMDEIWTASEYSRKAFENTGVTVPIRILPHVIDQALFNPLANPWKIENKRSFAFLSVFDFTPRKAWKDLLKAWWTAFPNKNEDVCLILKVFFGGFSEDQRKDVMFRIASYKREIGASGAPILVYGHDVPQNDMPGLYAACDCYVGISREGFGLPYAEALSCGLQCIGPEVGGNRQFMTPENSLLVRYEGDEDIDPEMLRINPFFSGLRWAKHSWEHLVENMRTAASKGKATRMPNKISDDLSPVSIGRQLISML